MRSKSKDLAKSYRDALARLLAGTITSPVLQKRAEKKGRFQITPRAVAIEANCGHTPLYRKKHKDILALILAESARDQATTSTTSISQQVSQLRQEIKSLTKDRDRLATHNVALQLRLAETQAMLARPR